VLYEESPDKIISKIREELDLLINEIVNYATPDLYLVGRKSRHLFLPLVNSRLLEKGFSPHFLNVNIGRINGKQVCILEPSGKTPKEISLLADSINGGTEKADIVSVMRNQGTRIKNIFCYGVNKIGVKYLDEKRALSPDKIFTLNLFDQEEYTVFNKKLERLFSIQNRANGY
jgi:hypothetical protein